MTVIKNKNARFKLLLKISLFATPFIFVGLIIGAYFGRAWVRSSGVTWYANTFYQPTVERRFKRNFGYVNEKFSDLNITVDQPDEINGCGGYSYEGFRLTLGCIKSASSGKIYDDEQFNQNWKLKAQQFENDLKSKGWKRINDVDLDIANLLDPSLYQPEISYSLQQGKIECNIRIGFNKRDTENRRVFVEELCSRGVLFFGGY